MCVSPSGGNKRQNGTTMQVDPLGEAITLASVPPHSNVMPAPLAAVVVESSDKASPDSQTSTLLVGIVLPYYTGPPTVHLAHETAADLDRCLRYSYQYVAGVHHLSKHGIFPVDLSIRNTLISAPAPHDRLLVNDFEPLPVYFNTDGVTAPELHGYWIRSKTQHGAFYLQQEAPERFSKSSSIANELADNPEAFERLEVFTVGCVLSQLVQCPVYFPWWTHRFRDDWLHSKEPRPARSEGQQEWTAKIPPSIRDLIQRCCSFDPRDRPLLHEMLSILEAWA